MKRSLLTSLLLVMAVFLIACGGAPEPAAEVAAEPTAAEPPGPTPTKFEKYALPMGQTEEGAFFIGREDAPVTMIDYSNFL